MMAGACMRRLADVHSGDRGQGAGRCTHTGSCTDTAGRYEAAPQQRISEPARPSARLIGRVKIRSSDKSRGTIRNYHGRPLFLPRLTRCQTPSGRQVS